MYCSLQVPGWHHPACAIFNDAVCRLDCLQRRWPQDWRPTEPISALVDSLREQGHRAALTGEAQQAASDSTADARAQRVRSGQEQSRHMRDRSMQLPVTALPAGELAPCQSCLRNWAGQQLPTSGLCSEEQPEALQQSQVAAVMATCVPSLTSSRQIAARVQRHAGLQGEQVGLPCVLSHLVCRRTLVSFCAMPQSAAYAAMPLPGSSKR